MNQWKGQEKDLFPRLKQLIMRGIDIFQDNAMMIYSGNATLFIITAVPPFIMLIISIVNLLPGYSTKDVATILLQILPDLAPIKKLLVSLIMRVKDQSGGLLASAAALTTLWSASNGIDAIQRGLNQLDEGQTGSGAEKEDIDIKETGTNIVKSLIKRIISTLILVILIPALLVFEMLGDSLAEAICNAVEKVAPDGLDDILSDVDSFFHVSSLVVIGLAILVLLMMYAWLPLKKRTLKSQLPGALFTGVCWLVFTKLFSFFIPRFYRASSLYGSLASVFMVLLWTRFIVVILFAGGVLNHALEEEKNKSQEEVTCDD